MVRGGGGEGDCLYIGIQGCAENRGRLFLFFDSNYKYGYAILATNINMGLNIESFRLKFISLGA